jgi:hypothetical protein
MTSTNRNRYDGDWPEHEGARRSRAPGIAMDGSLKLISARWSHSDSRDQNVAEW